MLRRTELSTRWLPLLMLLLLLALVAAGCGHNGGY